MELESRLDFAANWTGEERSKVYEERVNLLISFDSESRTLPVNESNIRPLGIIALISLVQEGFIKLDSNNPNLIKLTDSGATIASGYRAYSHG